MDQLLKAILDAETSDATLKGAVDGARRDSLRRMAKAKKIPTSVSGFGCLYRPKYTYKGELKQSAVWWLKYSIGGREIRRSSQTDDQSAAYAQLLKLASEHAVGIRTSASAETVTVAELLDLVISDYIERGRKTLYDLRTRVARIKQHFGELRAAALRTADVKAFIGWLKREGKQPATINRYLSNLHRAFELGLEHDPPLAHKLPVIPWQDESGNVRQGMLSEADYARLKATLPAYAALALVIGYHTGMRQGEILSLQWSQVDLEGLRITLDAGQVKNRKARIVPIWGEMAAYLTMARACSKTRFVIEYNGVRVRRLKGVWKRARLSLGIDILFHDLRRTALSRMEDAGIPRHLAMQASGHKTESAYRRYLIGTARDAERVRAALEIWQADRSAISTRGSTRGKEWNERTN